MGTPVEFFEKHLEDIIFDNKAVIHNHGLPKFRKTTFRQFILPSGKKLDIFSFDLIDGHIVIDIYELKLYRINTEAICQAYEYYRQIHAITAGYFKHVDIHIIMVGRHYDPIMIFEKMNLPFSAYTYEFKLTGMSFVKHIERREIKDPHQDFCLGLWAFGDGHLLYPNGDPSSINLANVYSDKRIVDKDTHEAVIKAAGSLFKEPIIKEVPVIQYLERPSVKTEVFPLQPDWTKEFAASIPDDEYMFDLQDDRSDYEPEVIEADLSDYECDPIEVEHEDEWFEVPEDEVILQPRIPMEDEFPMAQVNKYLKQITA